MFDKTYKRHAVELTLHGDRTVKAVAKELGLPAWQLYEWRKLYAPRPRGEVTADNRSAGGDSLGLFFWPRLTPKTSQKFKVRSRP